MKNKNTNKIITAGLVILLAVLSIFGVYYHNNVYKPKIDKALSETAREDITQNGPQKSGEKTLVAQTDDGSIKVYKDGDFVILEQNGKETEFSDWAENFGLTKTDIYYKDTNGDGSKEIIISDYEGEDEETKTPLCGIYILSSTQKNGEASLFVNYTNSNDWTSYFNQIISCHANQLKNSPQRIQFLMDYVNADVPYDVQTGIVTGDHKAWYSCAPQKEDGSYYSLYSIRQSDVLLEVDEKTQDIKATTKIYASFKNTTQEVYLGDTVCTIIVDENNEMTIKEKSIIFNVNPETQATDPRQTEKTAWENNFKNPASVSKGDGTLNDFACAVTLRENSSSTRNFSSADNAYKSESRLVESISVTNNSIKITAASGVSFAKELNNTAQCKAIIDIGENRYNAAQSVAVSTENSKSVLTITLDKSYSVSELENLVIVLGNSDVQL